jgi:hypothetical protein
MKIILLLGLLLLQESILPIRRTEAHPLIADEANHNATATATATATHQEQREAFAVEGHSPIVCDACKFLANGLNQTVLRSPKVIAFISEDLEQICSILPQSVQPLCSGAVNQTAPLILNHLGNFIATEGCSDLGVCDNTKHV